MLNIDDRILNSKIITDQEFWFLMQIAKRVRNSKGKCFPSISTIAKDTGYSEKKVRRIKSQMVNKKHIKVTKRFTKDGGRTSDNYTILLKGISWMMGLSNVELQGEVNETTHTQNGKGGTTQNGKGGTTQNGKGKLLTIETINNLISAVIKFLNETCDKKYKTKTEGTRKLIKGRLKEGYTLDDFKKVIRVKYAEWNNTEREIYLRPKTLFSPSNFENYVNQPETKKEKPEVVKLSYSEEDKKKLAEQRRVRESYERQKEEKNKNEQPTSNYNHEALKRKFAQLAASKSA